MYPALIAMLTSINLQPNITSSSNFTPHGLLMTGFPLSCLEKIPGVFHNFPGPQNVFPGLYSTVHSILHVRYWTYCTQRHPQTTHLTKCAVNTDAIPGCMTYGTSNISKFTVYCTFSVRKPCACWLIWTTDKLREFSGPQTLISRTFQDW